MDKKRAKLIASLQALGLDKANEIESIPEECVNDDLEPQARPLYGEMIDGLPAKEVRAGDKKELDTMMELQLFAWKRLDEIPEGNKLIDTTWMRQWK